MWWAVVAWRVEVVVVVVGFIRVDWFSFFLSFLCLCFYGEKVRKRGDDGGLQRGVREVTGAMRRRQAEGIRMIATAACREVAAPQVLVGEG